MKTLLKNLLRWIPMSMPVYAKSVIVALPLLLGQCHEDGVPSNRCQLEPDPGLCKAYIERYYYDSGAKKCKAFIWGGCQGVVPFETLAECENGCQGN
jgi:hypothetical protein